MLKYWGIRPKYQNQNGFGDLMLGPVGKSIEFRTRVDLDILLKYYMDGCQNYGPFLDTLNIRGRIIIGTQKGPIILTSPHILPSPQKYTPRVEGAK